MGFLGSIVESLSGGVLPDNDKYETEYHEDNGRTDRNEYLGSSFTYNSNGDLQEYSRPESSGFFGSHDVQVTYDGDGNVINVQSKND